MIQLAENLQGATLHFGRGFEVTSTGSSSGWLKKYRELPARSLVKYGPQPLGDLRTVPAKVYRKGLRSIYSGPRLLVARGIKGGGLITSRFESEKYCFRNSIHGVRFEGLEKWQESVITAIFWSSLARYFYFTTSGSWGFWHDEIHLEDVKQMPISFPQDIKLRNRIIRIVEQLQQVDVRSAGFLLFQGTAIPDLVELEAKLDGAIFDLYGLTAAERDLVQDKCSTGLDLFYEHHKGQALRAVVQPRRSFGTWSSLPRTEDAGLPAYLRTFLEFWNAELPPDSEFSWSVVSPPSSAPLLAVRFTTRYKSQDLTAAPIDASAAWSGVLADLQKHSLIPWGTSRIFIDTFFRYVSDREILFIKRNERRFWTPASAREDAESALTHLMNLEEGVAGVGR
jgi:hypothetical protein